MDEGHDGAAVAEGVALIVDRLGARAAEVIGDIQQHLAAEIGELRGDPQLLEVLRGSVAGNVETVFDALRYDIDIELVEPPTAALEYARRLAQHGVPVNALVRAYRLGHQRILVHALDEIRQVELESTIALSVFDTISTVTFGYIDWISQQVTREYEAERERWVENRNSVRAIRVRELLDKPGDHGGHIDIDAVTAAIRYPFRRAHLALILWIPAGDAPGRELLRLERFLSELAASMELQDGPLFVAADRVSGWGWLPLGPAPTEEPISHIRRFVEGYGDAPFLAVGAVHHGLAGFRHSHAQAREVRRVAVAGQCIDRVTAADDPGVSIAALLTDDLERTRAWVSDTLGPLAGDTPGDARLRETLRVFLHAGCSYKAAAEQLTLHHNSVRYRIERAVDRRGRSFLEDRLDVELALQFCHRFGAAVLRSAPER